MKFVLWNSKKSRILENWENHVDFRNSIWTFCWILHAPKFLFHQNRWCRGENFLALQFHIIHSEAWKIIVSCIFQLILSTKGMRRRKKKTKKSSPFFGFRYIHELSVTQARAAPTTNSSSISIFAVVRQWILAIFGNLYGYNARLFTFRAKRIKQMSFSCFRVVSFVVPFYRCWLLRWSSLLRRRF